MSYHFSIYVEVDVSTFTWENCGSCVRCGGVVGTRELGPGGEATKEQGTLRTCDVYGRVQPG